MIDDVQPVAGESAADPVVAAASAFKAAVNSPEDNEIPDPWTFADPRPVRDDEEEEAGPARTFAEQEAADDAQPSDPDDAQPAEAAEESAEPPLPPSWPAEKGELWRSLPPEAQAFIAARDGQMTAAVNLKFQEAAALKKAAEDKAAAEIGEAQLSRQRYAEAVDQVLSLVVPQAPPRSMLDRGSGDYDPDAYHYRKALHEDVTAFLNSHAAQRRELAAQDSAQRFDAINTATRDAFVASVPDAIDQAKAPAVFGELIDYAASLGAPADLFETPTTALEWHVLWKAREYDRLQSAKARVRDSAKPEPRKAAPAVRPGVATSRAAIEQSRARGALDRLRKEGSVEAGAAALKHLMKGKGNGESHQRRGIV